MINQRESNAISVLRVLAMLSVVACHILQGLDNPWAWILNVGVQIFLVMSGYLYGHKQIGDWKQWFVKRFQKLYIPYVLFVIVAVLAYWLFSDAKIGIGNVCAHLCNVQGIFGGVKELNHLWFMTAIALCYVVTPLLQLFRKYGNIMLAVLLVIGILQYGFFRFQLFRFSWFYLYAVGYFYALAGKRMKILFLTCSSVGLLYVLSFISWEQVLDYHNWCNRLLHDLLGFELFVTGIALFSLLPLKIKSLVALPDRLSFPVYITHHVFIMGSFSLLGAGNLFVSIVLILFLTVASALLLDVVSTKITKVLFQGAQCADDVTGRK